MVPKRRDIFIIARTFIKNNGKSYNTTGSTMHKFTTNGHKILGMVLWKLIFL